MPVVGFVLSCAKIMLGWNVEQTRLQFDPSPGWAVSKTILFFWFSHSITITQWEWYSSSQFDYLTFWTWVPSWQSVPQKTSNLFTELESKDSCRDFHFIRPNVLDFNGNMGSCGFEEPSTKHVDRSNIQFGDQGVYPSGRKVPSLCKRDLRKWPFEDCLEVARHQSSMKMSWWWRWAVVLFNLFAIFVGMSLAHLATRLLVRLGAHSVRGIWLTGEREAWLELDVEGRNVKLVAFLLQLLYLYSFSNMSNFESQLDNLYSRKLSFSLRQSCTSALVGQNMSRYHALVLTVYFAWSFNVRIAPGAKANVTQAVPSNLWDVVLPKGGSRLTVDLRWCICIGYQSVPSYNRLLDSASNPNLNYWSVLKFPGCFSVRSIYRSGTCRYISHRHDM